MKLVKKTQKNEDENDISGKCEISAGDGGDEGGKTVVVGVRLDQESKELLTWALMKVAQPGDHVIALHVLHYSNEIEQSTLISLVKTLDSTLAAYEGFCKLKQVDLKLKVCRGSSLRKILVREAKTYESGTLILGTCKAQHMIRSSTSVAKYCARKLPNSFSVFAVDDGKIAYQKQGNCTTPRLVCGSKVNYVELDGDKNTSIKTNGLHRKYCESFEKHYTKARRNPLIKRYFGCGPISPWAHYPYDEMEDESCDDESDERSLALIPYQATNESSMPNLIINKKLHGCKSGWPLLRRVLFPRNIECDRVLRQKRSMGRRVLKNPGRQSSIAVHPDQKKSDSGEIVVEVATSSPSSTFKGLELFTKELEELREKYSSTCVLFAYQDLLSATSDFSPENMVGKGGSSQVFRGRLSNGKEIAVKLLKPSDDVLHEFIAEIEIITTVSHKNILSLTGFCFEEESLILIYDLLSRGSVEDNLHGNESKARAFGWEERYKVAIGVAEALNYLHNRDLQSVIHRDIKSSNILLSDKFEAQLADFGLATRSSNASSYLISSDVAGTFGYLAPEYFMHGKVTDKMDVYSFGVVLLELLSGRKPIDSRNPKGKESIVIWANSVLKDEKLSEFLDPRLSGDYSVEQIERMILAATLCIRREPQTRPGIGNILKLLEGDSEVIKWANQQVKNYPLDFEVLDGETPKSVIESHMKMAFLDLVEDETASISSTEQNITLEDFLTGRCSSFG